MDTLKIVEDQTASAQERTYLLHGVGAIGRERLPLASAEIRGNAQNSTVKGNVSFYYTPLGTLVCACVSGLSAKRGIYTLRFVSDKGGADAFAIPPLYERGGYAWCSTLTAKLSHNDLVGRELVMYLSRKKEELPVATAVIRS